MSSFANETGVDALEMTYEGLAADPIGAGRSVLRFLDVPMAGVELTVQTQRQFDETNDEWINRYKGDRGGLERPS